MKKQLVLLVMLLPMVTLPLLVACGNDSDDVEQSQTDIPKVFYNVELADIESHGSMLNEFGFEELKHNFNNGNEYYMLYYFHDPGARKEGLRNRVAVVWDKVNNFQSSFEYTFQNSIVELKYTSGEMKGKSETLVLKKAVKRILIPGDLLYINDVPYKRLSSFNETY